MNGEQVRNTRILLVPHHGISGYDQRQVDDLVLRVAAELDAGRPAGPLIENATFRRRSYRRRYDIDAVDWLLGQLPTEISGLAFSQLAPDEVGAGRRRGGEYFVEQCEDAWRDFGQLPGVRLWWGKAGRALSELRTSDQQTLASERVGRWSNSTVNVGGRSFAFKAVDGTAQPAPPGADEFFASVARDAFGHFTTTLGGYTQPWRSSVRVGEFADETGTPALYTCGVNFNFRAYCSIMFPDHRRLRFLVRGTERSNAIMTAVDQTGKSAARYRIVDKKTTEIVVNPGWELTDELTLAIAISAPWLDSYFQRPESGG